MVATIEALRLEIRKQWDVAHDYKCNRRCACESYGRTGTRCKYPPPEILNDEQGQITSGNETETNKSTDFAGRRTVNNSPYDKC